MDFAALIESWTDLEKTTMAFESNSNINSISEEKEKIKRFYYKTIPFDIVPFGGIEHNHTISWPPFYDTI